MTYAPLIPPVQTLYSKSTRRANRIHWRATEKPRRAAEKTNSLLLIEADLPEETGHEHNEWMETLASHAATDVYESADDYDVVDVSLTAICLARFCP